MTLLLLAALRLISGGSSDPHANSKSVFQPPRGDLVITAFELQSAFAVGA